jgi:hypothetical protein
MGATYRYNPIGRYPLQPGTRAAVKNCAFGYPLPAGLEEGTTVRVLGFKSGYYSVRIAGRRYSVFMANLVRV